jgi:hypothetical protein
MNKSYFDKYQLIVTIIKKYGFNITWPTSHTLMRDCIMTWMEYGQQVKEGERTQPTNRLVQSTTPSRFYLMSSVVQDCMRHVKNKNTEKVVYSKD